MATRHNCPACGHRKTFSRYIDTTSGSHLAPYVGRCERLDNCGYHFTPKQFFEANPDQKPQPDFFIKPMPKPTKPFSQIPMDICMATLKNYDKNNFVTFLIGLFGVQLTSELVAKYFIGTSKHWPGAAVFWQIDLHGRIRTGKIMLYDPATGKRVKEPYSHITWVHTKLHPNDFELRQCFFGEHLLAREPLMPVGIVESEKTAVIASGYFPGLIWLGAGNKEGLSSMLKCNVLQNRKILLFPDLNAYELWFKKAKQLSNIASIKVSNLLETLASVKDKEKGSDLADYLCRYSARFFV